ncbi:PIG-L deacetylase family protein [Palleronia rufa]|uniref:PIG-L deacetylase family protein n=1 Tax=Palleronia rufa TaxID=1530186 RepID=UPI00068B6AFB|nr:PIG-L family deacetylase [Palleronia rufa]
MTGDLAPLIEGRAPVLVLAPHADDESLACGLMLAARWGKGLPAHVACLTDGAASHPRSRRWPAPRLAALRRAELEAAVTRLGGLPARDLTWLSHPDAGLHRVHGPGADLGRDVARLVDRLGARVLVAASGADPHCDHEACAAAARRVAAARPGLALYDYPVWSRWQGWSAGRRVPGLRLDLPEWRAAKTDAVAAHRSQMGLVVDDDPDGFAMPPGFAARFCTAPEAYLPVPA